MVSKISIAAVFMTVVSIIHPPISLAQVEIIDRNPPQSDNYSSASPVKSVNSGSSTVNVDSAKLNEMYYQIQVLQQEVMELRGKVEEQEHHLKRLKKQRLDDYVDLDRRLGEFSNAKSLASSKSKASKRTSSNEGAPESKVQSKAVSKSDASPSDEIASYREAIDLVLKKKDYEKAAHSFSNHLLEFPEGRYSGNAQYWLGEIYLQRNDLSAAKKWFSELLSASPSHTKALDAKFKLGKVYDLLGEKDKALVLLKEVSNADGTTASLAKDYIKKHFSS